MQNQDEGPRYTDPGHPYSGSGSRYQNQYTCGRSAGADKPFQFPWWAIVLPLVLGMWPVSIVLVVLNKLIKDGKLGGFEQTARRKTIQFTHHSVQRTSSVYEGEFRTVDENAPAAANQADGPIYNQTAPWPQTSAEVAEKQGKKAGIATALTVAGVALLFCALIALPDGIFWLPDAGVEGGY